MTDAINLGDFRSKGIASNVDFEEIIKEKTAFKEKELEKVEDRVTLEEDKRSTWVDLQVKLGKLKAALGPLHHDYTVDGVRNNIFESRAAILKGNNEDEGNVSVNVSHGADIGIHKMQVDQLAESEKWRSRVLASNTKDIVQAAGDHSEDKTKLTAGTFKVAHLNNAVRSASFQGANTSITEPTAGGSNPLKAGSFSINSYSVSIKEGDTLTDVKESINSISDYTKVTATIENEGSDYFIVMRSKDLGIENKININDKENILNGQFDNSDINYQWTDWTEIQVKQGSSIQNVASLINMYTNQTGMRASIMRIGEEQYQMSFVSTLTGVGNEFKIDDPDHVFNNVFTSDDQKERSKAVASKTDPFVTSDGTIKVNGIDISLAKDDTLEDIGQKINNASAGVTATIEQGAEGFHLILQANDNGILGDAATYTLEDPSKLLSGIFTGENLDARDFTRDLQKAKDAILKLDEVTLKRKSNIINDVYADGKISFRLHAPTKEPFTFEVIPNVTEVAKSIIEFVDAYNEVRKAITHQDMLDDNGSELEISKLRKDITLREISFNVQSLMSVTTGMRGVLNRLSDIGVVVVDNNLELQPIDLGDEELNEKVKKQKYMGLFKIDQTRLEKVLTNNYEEVRRVLEYDFTSTSKNFFVGSDRGAGVQNVQYIEKLEYDIDLDRAVTKSTQSLPIATKGSDIVNPKGDHTNPESKFTAGTFFLNDRKITLEPGDSLEGIAQKINKYATSTDWVAEIEGSNSQYRLNFKYKGKDSNSWRRNLHIMDPDSVLNKVFDVKAQTQQSQSFADINTSVTNASGDHSNSSLLTPGTFKIDGKAVTIAENDTLEAVANKINSLENSNVLAEIVDDGVSANILLKAKVAALQGEDYEVEDTDNVLNDFFAPPAANDTRKNRFYDTTNVVKASLAANGQSIDKLVKYKLNSGGNKLTETSELTVIDREGDTISGYNFKSYYIASQRQDNTIITASQGIADIMYGYLERVTDTHGVISQAIKEIELNKMQHEADVERVKQRVDNEIADLKRQLASIEAYVEWGNQMLQMLDITSKLSQKNG